MRTCTFAACALMMVAATPLQVPPANAAPAFADTCKLVGGRSGFETFTYILNLTHPSRCIWEVKGATGVGDYNMPQCGTIEISHNAFLYTTVKGGGCKDSLTFVFAGGKDNVTVKVVVTVK